MSPDRLSAAIAGIVGDLVHGGRHRAVSQNARCDEGMPVSRNAG